MTKDDKALVELMRNQIESWEFEDPRSSWWKWQHQYAEAADRIEALSARLESANEALREQLDIRATIEAENERLREALFELQNQDIGRLHDLLNQALLLMRDDDMELPGSDHWVWALDAIAALGGKK